MIRAVESPRSRTLPQLLDEMASRQPQREFIVGAEARLTYAETRTRVRRLAQGLYRLGVRRGEKVALLMNNRTEWLLVDFAVALLGATLVRQDYLAMLAEIGAPGSDRLPQLRRVVSVGDERPAGMVPFEDLWNMGADVSEATLDACQHAVGPDDVAYILYTSGTTSTPKGVQLQHRGLIENTWHIGERQHLGPGDRMWMGISLFWSFGCLNALLAVMTHGGCIVLQEHFDAAAALALIERERCTVYYGTPNIALALWEHPDRARRDLSSLRTGAAIGPASDPVDVRLHTVGRPLPGMEIRIVNRDTRRPLAAGEIGEILIRGQLTPGYYKDPERNAAAFDTEGFFLTGDLGLVDNDGRLHFRGRIKEMVKTGGINVAPLEVEEVLLGHASVEQAHVIGLPDPRLEEILVAVVVLKDGRDASPEELRGFCKQALAAFKVPQHFRIMKRADLPVTATGKVQKFRLQEALSEELRGARS